MPSDSKRRVSKDLFLRVDIDFVLSDPRCVMLSDREFRVYVQLSALALQSRRELLPARFDVKSTAFLLHTTATQLQTTVTQLCSGPDPLLEIDCGRIRVRGLRSRYDGRFRWKDSDADPDSKGVTDRPHGDWVVADNCAAVAHNCNAVADNCKTTALEVDVDVDVVEPEVETPPDPPQGGCPTHQKADVADTLPATPPELLPLKLYAKDEKLCKKWPDMYPTWIDAHPHLDVMAEVKKAHAWEMARTAKKQNRPVFLTNWLNKAHERSVKDAPKQKQTEETGKDENGEYIILNWDQKL